jgi:PhnB protein
MKTIHAFLTFNGDCREAMAFYQKCLGGKLTLQTVGESSLSEKMPKKVKDCILYSALINSRLILMGSDMVPESGLIRGNAISLVLNCDSEKDIRRFYERLSTGGQATHPLEDTFWGALFGGLTDKYGNNWLLNFGRNQMKNRTPGLLA